MTINELSQQIAALVDHATGLALQGDSAAAADALATLQTPIHDNAVAEFRDCMIRRFGSDSTAGYEADIQDAWVAGLVKLYVAYWHSVLTKRESLEAAELNLQEALNAFLGHSNDDYDTLEAAIQAEIGRRGYYALLGRTLPLLELILWKQQRVVQVEVQLPESMYPMTVTYMDEFVLRGWGHYATCGRRATGGWATKEGLFAVVPAYKRIDDEAFTVRFLGHEAQHSLDMQTFEHLESWELEYRAKLTELVLGQTILADTLRRFCENRSENNTNSAHAYANFLVIQHLEQRLSNSIDLCRGAVGDEGAIRAAAKALLMEDTQKRTS